MRQLSFTQSSLGVAILFWLNFCGAAAADVVTDESNPPAAEFPSARQLIQRVVNYYQGIKTLEIETMDIRQSGAINEQRLWLCRWRVPDRYYATLLSETILSGTYLNLPSDEGFTVSDSPFKHVYQDGAGKPIHVTLVKPGSPPLPRHFPSDLWEFKRAVAVLTVKDATSEVAQERRLGQNTYHLHVSIPGSDVIGVAHVGTTDPRQPHTSLAADQVPPMPGQETARTSGDWWIRERDGAVIECYISGVGRISTIGPHPDPGRPISHHIVMVSERVNAAMPDKLFEIPQ